MLEILSNNRSLFKDQPGTVLMMKAKPGSGDELFDLINSTYQAPDSDVATDWILCRPNDEPDTLWSFEFFREEGSLIHHYAKADKAKGLQRALDLLLEAPFRADIRIVVSNSAPDHETRAVKQITMFEGQPGVILRLQAKPSLGNSLFEITTDLHYTGDQDDPVDWALCRLNDDPDALWAFEFYKDEDSYKRHYANPAVDKGHFKVGEVMSGKMLIKAEVHLLAYGCSVAGE